MSHKSGWQLGRGGPEAYEKYIVPAFSRKWARDLVERARLIRGERVLDLGCGTGIVSRCVYDALGDSGRITGADINETVLAKAAEICPPHQFPIEFRQGSAQALPLSDGAFDVALCQQGLQYFPDPAAALGDLHRVLAPEGRLVFSVWRPIEYSPFYMSLHNALQTYVNPEAAATLASAYTFRDAEVLRGLFKTAGFTAVRIRIVTKQMRVSRLEEFLTGGLGASPFAGDIMALAPSEREAMFRDIMDGVSGYMDDGGLAAPMESFVISAKR